jgi:hypothetical protein
MLLGALLIATAVGAAETSHKIVLIGGPKSEGPGRHDYAIAVRVLDQLLKSSPDLRNVDIESHPARWPEDAALGR